MLRTMSMSIDGNDEEEISRLAITTLNQKEEEIEKKKMQVIDRVELQLTRAEQETWRLAQVLGELEVLEDPVRKEVASVRKKIDTTNRELKHLAQSCQRKEKDYKEATESLNCKSKEKAQLVTILMELLGESERLRTKKLEELSKNTEYLH